MARALSVMIATTTMIAAMLSYPTNPFSPRTKIKKCSSVPFWHLRSMINWWDGRWSDREIEWKDRNGLQGGVWFRELGVLIVVYLMIYMFFFTRVSIFLHSDRLLSQRQ